MMRRGMMTKALPYSVLSEADLPLRTSSNMEDETDG